MNRACLPLSKRSFAGFAVLIGLVGASCLVACTSTGVGNPPEELTGDESQLLSDGEDATSAGDTASSLTAVPILRLDAATNIATPLAAANAAEGTTLSFKPLGCAAKTHTLGSTVVTYTFTRPSGGTCDGPFGLVDVQGTLTVAFAAASSGGVQATISSGAAGSFQVGTSTVSLSTTATVDFDASGTRQASWTGSYQGTNAAGEPVDHQASYTWSFDDTSNCVQIDGTATTTVGPRAHTDAVQGYERCGRRTACPDSGVFTFARTTPELQVMLTFSGDATAVVDITSRKLSLTLPLTCTTS